MDVGKPVTSNVARAETTALNTKVNKEVFDSFKDYCSYLGYSMNVVLETFMRQYANGRYELEDEAILRFKTDKNEKEEVDTLNTTFNKAIYLDFKAACKANGFFVKHVVTAFMEEFGRREVMMEYVKVADVYGYNKDKE